MEIGLILLLLIAGIIFLAIEAFVIPGFGLPGVLGAILLISGWILSFSMGIWYGALNMGGSVVLCWALLWYGFKKKYIKKWALKTQIISKSKQNISNELKINQTGITVSRLAPMGQIKINNMYLEATSWDGFIPEQTEIIITKVENGNVYVSQLKSN